MNDFKKIVAAGYDRLAERYDAWASQVRVEERNRYLRLLLDSLPAGASVLELGCGSGSPVTRALVEKFRVIGVDIARRQLEMAKTAAPSARFVCADMSDVEFRAGTFDAVAAFYSIMHVPRSEHAQLFKRVFTWMRGGGLLLVSLGVGNKDVDYEADWLGVPMYWSSFDLRAAREAVAQAGFHIVSAKVETADEDGVPVSFLWICARKY